LLTLNNRLLELEKQKTLLLEQAAQQATPLSQQIGNFATTHDAAIEVLKKLIPIDVGSREAVTRYFRKEPLKFHIPTANGHSWGDGNGDCIRHPGLEAMIISATYGANYLPGDATTENTWIPMY